MMDPRKLTHVSGSSYTWFIFNLNTKQCYSQITYTTYTCTDVCTQQRWFLVNPSPCFILPLSHDPTLLFTYLEILLLLIVVRIPIHSCPWFAINFSPLAASPTPMHPIDQVTYLHRRHQKHQASRLTQVHPSHPSQKILEIIQKKAKYRLIELCQMCIIQGIYIQFQGYCDKW